jgi:ATP-dependent RNA helicase RhlE
MARGIDVPGLPFVVNFDVPFVPEEFVHRIGRTGSVLSFFILLKLCLLKSFVTDSTTISSVHGCARRQVEQEIKEQQSHS